MVFDRNTSLALDKGVGFWNDWRSRNPKAAVHLSKVTLPDRNLTGVNFSGADLAGANLRGVTLSNADLTGANLIGADMREAECLEANFESANLEKANLSFARIDGARFIKTTLGRAQLISAICSGVNFLEAALRGTDLSGADLNGSAFVLTDMSECSLTGANLDHAILVRADLTKATFNGTLLGSAELNSVIFRSEHQSLYDYSEYINEHRRDKLLNWAVLRYIGTLPLFGLSWGALAISIAALGAIGLTNEEIMPLFLHSAATPHEIAMPTNMALLFFSSLFLVVGTTLYVLACPSRIQEFSEVQWVEQHGRPRLQYIAERRRRKVLQWPTLVFTATGGIVGLYLLADRVWATLQYLL